MLVLDHGVDPDGEADTVERGPDLRWLWLAIAVVVATVGMGIAGAIVGNDSSPPPARAPAEPETTSEPARADQATPEDGAPEPTVPPTDIADPLAASNLTPRAQLPDRVPPFESTDPIVIIGHHPGGALAAVRPDGSVTELVESNGRGFLPQTSNGRTLVGLLHAGATTVVIAPDGTPGFAVVDNRDAPVYRSLHDGSGYVVHGTWLGRVHYIGNDGAEIGNGPDLARGTRVLGDTQEGLAIEAIDGTALIIDRETGDVVRRLASVPLRIAGTHQVVVVCRDGTDCSIEIQTLDGTTTGVLDTDPVIAGRLIVGMSRDGTRIAYRQQPEVKIADVTGATVVSFVERSLDRVLWVGDTVISVGQSIQLWDPGLDGPVVLDIGDAIDPDVRGITALTDGAVDPSGLLVPISSHPNQE